MTTEPKKCAHQTCRCLVSPEKNFCGPWCEGAKNQDAAGGIGECGHPSCHESMSERD